MAALYDPAAEHAACGLGFVARSDGKRSHEIVEHGLTLLRNLAHRGATGSDPDTGDGAGMLLQMPDAFLRRVCTQEGISLPTAGGYATGLLFLSPDPDVRRACELEMERIAAEEGQPVLGWRDVPVRPERIGRVARSVMPCIRQVFLVRRMRDEIGFTRRLYVIRRRLHWAVQERFGDSDACYVVSLSASALVYKGLLTGPQLAKFYPDLLDGDVASALALIHSRFSTNTLGAWPLAHPYRYVAHNGEINALRGNVNWLRAREHELQATLFPDHAGALGPIVQPNGSDTAAFDNALEFLLLAGRSLPHAIMTMVPEAWENDESMDPERRAFYQFTSALTTPWDGPAAIAFSDGRIVGATLDRNGLRPARYSITRDGLVILASEEGALPVPPEDVVSRWRLGPGRMLVVDTARKRILDDDAAKRQVVRRKPYRRWVAEGATTLDHLPLALPNRPPETAPLIDRQRAFGYTLEDLRLILMPMAEHGKEPDGSMGTDTPLAVLSRRPQSLFSYFHQLFAQVSNPPIDPLRESTVMSLRMSLGPEINLIEERPEHCEQIVVEHPILLDEELERLRHHQLPPFHAATLSLLFPVQSVGEPSDRQAHAESVRSNGQRWVGTAAPVPVPPGMHSLLPESWKSDVSRGRTGTGAAVPTMPVPGRTVLPREAGDECLLERALDALCKQAEQEIENGASILILSDRGIDAGHAAIPSLLATAAVHHHLVREGMRTRAGLVVETGEAREVHHLALLIGYGAAAVNPYLALETVGALAEMGQIEGVSREQAIANYVQALRKGLLKVISKMGISTLVAYCGAQIFEAVGIAPAVIDRYFTGTVSRVGGLDLAGMARETLARHAAAFGHRTVSETGTNPVAARFIVPATPAETGTINRAATVASSSLPGGEDTDGVLDIGGEYQFRQGAEYHHWNPASIAALQRAVQGRSWASFKQFSQHFDTEAARAATLRGLFALKRNPIALEEVEPAEEIVKRFSTGAMSFGSLSQEAHETLAVAMNHLGGKSNTGEGGEEAERFGDERRSAIKQVASARFGVTAEYLVNADVLQIKMAQGAKPGEGGQLPGHKVSEDIARVRHSTPGVTLISPPPHHDIYSIEDLAQLIHDLKNVNPAAEISVKLVAEAGVGTIAAGVAKARAEHITIAGHDGGTGASPLASIKHAGLPWELGLAEAQHVLVRNDLRGRVRLQADGGIKTGRDVVIAALLGAEEFAFSTAPLVATGCIMMRACHLNTCPVGIATQNPVLRRKFAGKPEHVINYFFFLAQEVRELMAELGFRRMDEMVGRVDRLGLQPALDHWKAEGLDLGALLATASGVNESAARRVQAQEHGLNAALDRELIRLAEPALARRQPVRLELPIANTNRTAGGMLSGEIARRYGAAGLSDGTIRIDFKGIAGQSFGAWGAKGLTMVLEGEVNDYAGKGLSGARLVVTPPPDAGYKPDRSIVAGNVALYGATSGEAYFRGMAGERFAIRNSGAQAVVEGVGDHGCEYMTGGAVLVLGPTGRNFAAGMSGGLAFVLDLWGRFAASCNLDMVDLEPLEDRDDIALVRRLLKAHLDWTGSDVAQRVLLNWGEYLPRFVKVMPHDLRRALAEREEQDDETPEERAV
jgi:glutamate synthase domain-containing protein 2/glutamate synthase domain-containing protein 1/glutamate synthase domain-containing protein 3